MRVSCAEWAGGSGRLQVFFPEVCAGGLDGGLGERSAQRVSGWCQKGAALRMSQHDIMSELLHPWSPSCAQMGRGPEAGVGTCRRTCKACTPCSLSDMECLRRNRRAMGYLDLDRCGLAMVAGLHACMAQHSSCRGLPRCSTPAILGLHAVHVHWLPRTEVCVTCASLMV